MEYTVTFLETHYDALQRFLFSDCLVERAAMLRCRLSVTATETRFLVRAVHLFEGSDLNHATADDVSITSSAFMRVLKRADDGREAVIFVHSHPIGPSAFSSQDDRTEPPFFATAFNRVRRAPVHGSLVFVDDASFAGRVWLPDGSTVLLERLRVIGNRWRFLSSVDDHAPIPVFFDRQVRAFGAEFQRLLARLHIGVVGAGGTGSPVLEQLVRLGVGRITQFDPQDFEATNANRVYNSRVTDEGSPKVGIAERFVAETGLGARFEPVQASITSESVAKRLRDCDVIFGCTDDHWGRAILNAVAIRYLIPVIDMGVKIDVRSEHVEKVIGRVTILQPGCTCLLCRKRIDPEQIRAASLDHLERARLRAQGYVAELDQPDPAVIPFTTATAAAAVGEFMARLTGFTGDETPPSELLHFFEARRVASNRGSPRTECFCQDQRAWGSGDAPLFLDMTWPLEAEVTA